MILIFFRILHLFPKIATRGLFNYFGIVPQVEKQKIEDLVHIKFKGIIFYLNFLKKIKDQESLKFTGNKTESNKTVSIQLKQ